jgi:hypothetical protein
VEKVPIIQTGCVIHGDAVAVELDLAEIAGYLGLSIEGW